jgi:hypothetical protein
MGGEDVRNGVDEAADVVLADLQDQRLAGREMPVESTRSHPARLAIELSEASADSASAS